MRFATMSHENFNLQQFFDNCTTVCTIETYDSAQGLHSAPHKIAKLLQFRAIDTHDLTKFKGCSVNSKMSILLQFCVIDTHDLAKWLLPEQQNVDFTTVSRHPHVRFYEMLATCTAKIAFSFARSTSTRTMLRKGCISASIFRTTAPSHLFIQ